MCQPPIGKIGPLHKHTIIVGRVLAVPHAAIRRTRWLNAPMLRVVAHPRGVRGAVVTLIVPASASAAVALHIHIDGVINPIKARYVHQALERRERGEPRSSSCHQHAGGLVSSMRTSSVT